MPTYLPSRLGLSHSEAIAEAYASATAGDPVLLTLEVSHPAFSEPARVVNDFRDLTATLEATAPYNPSTAVLFSAVPFRYTKPEQTAESANAGAPAAVGIEIDNVSGYIAELLIQAKESMEPVTVIEREYLPSDTSAPHVVPVTVMTMSNIVIGVETVRANLSFGDLTNRKFPAKVYQEDAGTWPRTEYGFSAVLDLPGTSGAGVTINNLDPTRVYNITLPIGQTYVAWSAWQAGDPNAGGLEWIHDVFVTPAGSSTVIRGTGGRYATAEAARAAFPVVTLTGASSYTFSIPDSNLGDNRGGLSIKIST